MDQSYTFDIHKRKKWMLILPAALFVAFFLFLESQYSFTVFSDQSAPKALSSGNSEQSSVALTFNISWGEEQLEPILDLLSENGTTATFFISGEWAELHPDLMEDIEAGGHEIGMLGYQYKSYLEMDKDAIQKDILKAKDTFTKLGYENTYLFRAPNGHLNEEIISMVENQGLKMIQWSVNPNDWKNPGTDKIVDHVLSETNNGDIILMHASDSVKQTEDALSEIIPQFKNQQLQLTTISELITGAESEQDELESNRNEKEQS
ncbi:polysaccharide deacetylase [Gracilibacillus halophilus YIM-C55.5]|uniref:Polysaccharide deacetylase n=1 Tax=Gracilibacillus halophilus YIM-C55.5 TaxID=1308866 RepID=N4WEY9_9BACI|nr:polysaccharide deacetylase family sporulation protein PdaB [Gracilibacillus halophilus]ENH97834.1 polysaccharide deacetylase [Gracilibacillus halophilus YIM-C55.5]